MITSTEEIKKAILSLPDSEYVDLRDWILKRDWEIWEKKIQNDAKAGKLDFLIEEAREEKAKGNLNPFQRTCGSCLTRILSY